MKNNEDKLFSSIGRIDDDVLDSALAYKPEKAESKGRTISIKKKLTAIALAAVMCMGLIVTVSAYGDDILAAITQRKRELIDDKSQIINKAVTAKSGCSLTVDNVASGYFYFSIHSGNEPFTNGLKYERLQVMYKTSPELNVTYSEPVEMGDWYLVYDGVEGMGDFFANVERIDYDSENPTSTVQYKLTAHAYNTTYKIIVAGITSEDGSIKYADELSLEFDVDLSDKQTLSQVQFHRPSPDIEFELDGSKYQVYEVSMHDPYRFTIKIMNLDEEVIEYDGKEYYGVTRFDDSIWMTKEWADYLEQERTMAYIYPELYTIDGASEEIKAQHDELMKKMSNAMQDSLSISNQHELYSTCYNINIELSEECGASIKNEPNVRRSGANMEILEFGEESLDMTMCVSKGFAFTSPIYITDIKRVYVTKNSDPDFELTIYEPQKDLSLFDTDNAE